MAIKLTDSHFFVARCLGAVMIGQAVTWALCRNSADQKMFGNQLFARVVVSKTGLKLLNGSCWAYFIFY